MFSEIVSFVVERYAGPLEERVSKIAALIVPELSGEKLKLGGRSIIGQCVFYVTHRPFIERLDGEVLDAASAGIVVAQHISRFSLAGLGCSQELIDTAITATFQSFPRG